MTLTREQGYAANTDRELWREREGDYYADSIHVTESGAIGINCGGHVIVLPVRKWHAFALQGLQNSAAQVSTTDLPQPSVVAPINGPAPAEPNAAGRESEMIAGSALHPATNRTVPAPAAPSSPPQASPRAVPETEGSDHKPTLPAAGGDWRNGNDQSHSS